MSDPFLIGWDLGTARNGWCAGGGESTPVAGGFRLGRVTPDEIGDMGCEFSARVMDVSKRYPQATHWISERPLLFMRATDDRPYADDRFKVERLMGLSCLLQTIGRKLGKVCKMVEPGSAKMEFAGRHASKDMMVEMALALGIELPEHDADGREDAADACGVWKVGLRLFARHHLQRFDGAIYTRRGSLV
ncbi:MAG TPA: hypothetical protein VIJ94_00975 [Caulobacteraceae bacterium]